MLNEKGDEDLQLKIKVIVFKLHANLNLLGIINFPGIIQTSVSKLSVENEGDICEFYFW